MAIITYGFDGTMSEAGWAVVAAHVGRVPGVSDSGALAVSAGGAGSRAVTVAAGTVSAFGVSAVNTADINLNASTVPAGTRWDTVAARFSWSGAGGSVTFVVLAGGSAKALASSLNTNPGVAYDVPLALIRVTSTSTVVQEVQDVRQFGSGNVSVLDPAALPFITAPNLTLALVNRGGVQPVDTYVRDAGQWVQTSGVIPSNWMAHGLVTGHVPYTNVPEYTKINGVVYNRGSIQRSNGAALLPANTELILFRMPVGFRPGHSQRFAAAASYAGSGGQVRLQVLASGEVIATAEAETLWVETTFSYLYET